jgi:flagellar assembly protein FliH
MSSNADSVYETAVASLEYKDIAGPAGSEGVRPLAMDERPLSGGARMVTERARSEAELTARIARERAEASAQAELKVRQEMEQKLQAAQTAIAKSLKEFAEQRNDYFTKVEAEIVQLSLSIAAKILHREAQVDPMLVATLVRIAVERMREDSGAIVRVGPGRAAAWKQYVAGQPSMARVEVVEDKQLSGNDCVLETELGSANFGLEAQLKEVEQGFFDLLALRPENQ